MKVIRILGGAGPGAPPCKPLHSLQSLHSHVIARVILQAKGAKFPPAAVTKLNRKLETKRDYRVVRAKVVYSS